MLTLRQACDMLAQREGVEFTVQDVELLFGPLNASPKRVWTDKIVHELETGKRGDFREQILAGQRNRG
jgi:hypothetical protein